jgi:hypothetical protein
MLKQPVNPCGRDCAKRCAGCAVDCKEWHEYVEARNAYYDARHEVKRQESMARDRAIRRKIRRVKEGYE